MSLSLFQLERLDFSGAFQCCIWRLKRMRKEKGKKPKIKNNPELAAQRIEYKS